MVAQLSAAESIPWKNADGARYFEVTPVGKKKGGFSMLDGAATGVQFTNTLGRRLVAMNRVTEDGSGVALGDFDGDGWCDIYLCGLERSNALFRNLGNWKFEDVTERAGVACEKQLSTGAIFGDVDGDGDLDLLVNSIGAGTRLFLNNGAGVFMESPGGRLVHRFGSSSLALGDIDRDGDLDLYVTNYRTIIGKDEFPRAKVEARMQNGEVIVTPPGRYKALPARSGSVEVFELGERDFLYVNDGKGQFSPVSWTNGNFLDASGKPLTAAPQEWSLSVMMRDLNDDGFLDIVVCNDFFNSPDQIWFQQPGMIFQLAGIDSIRKLSLASMAVDVADINRDGLDDLFFAEMLSRDYGFRQNHRDNQMKSLFNLRMPGPGHRWEIPRNTLFLNRGDGSYAEIAELAGVDASEWSWGAIFLDVDLDGWEDLLIPTGHNHDVQNADVLRKIGQSSAPDSIEERIRNLQQFPKLNTPIIAYRNDHGLRFSEQQEAWGLDIPGVLNGFACADLDNDGDLDLVGNRLNASALLFRNESSERRIAIRLAGAKGNSRGIGAKISVRPSQGPAFAQRQEILGGGRYLSCDDTLRTFACLEGATMNVEVLWPDAHRTVLTNIAGNRVYEIARQGAALFSKSANPEAAFFADRTDLLNHRHADPDFADFDRQPFLPYNLGTQGPALAWYDVDRDGREDLIIGGARGGQMAIRHNRGGGFEPVTNALTAARLLDDQMGVIAARLDGTDVSIISATANYETGGRYTAAGEVRTLANGNVTLPPETDTPGPLALADVDSDGDLDLFIGGRVVPGRYPAAASSRIYLNDKGALHLDENWSRPFVNIGLCAGAAFSDFNNDGRPDLALALEWGEIRVFISNGRTLTGEVKGLEGKRGFWTSIATGDFNNDGLTDIVAGNWGRNTKYERFIRLQPIRVYYGDLDGNGSYDLFEAIFNPSLQKYVPVAGPEMIIEHFPTAAERIPSYGAYARVGIEELLGPSKPQMLEINTMDSMVFLNRGDAFESRALPIEAQFAPVFGLAVADLDNDGHEDLVLGQNLFDTRWDFGRLDSGRPLWLRGDGQGNFTTTSSLSAGLTATGQQRAVALADYNADGRIDIAVSQNNDQTRLFENRGAPAGVRLRLIGSANNPDAIGARYRQSGTGPVREIQAGSGWLSQNSFIQIAPRPTNSEGIVVQWPGGRTSQFTIPPNVSELELTEAGAKVVR